MEKPKTKLAQIIETLDISKNIASHMLGENHSLHHRYITSGAVMVTGVLISHYGTHLTEFTVVQIFSDMIGYAIHGIGAIPLVENIIKNAK